MFCEIVRGNSISNTVGHTVGPFVVSNGCCILRLKVDPKPSSYHRNLKTPESCRASHGNH